MNFETAKQLAELWPVSNTRGWFEFCPDQTPELSFGFDLWRIRVGIPGSTPILLGQGDLASPYGQAFVEKTLELIAEREFWRLSETMNPQLQNGAKFHCDVLFFEGMWRRHQCDSHGATRLEARAAAMIEAKKRLP